MRFTPAVRNALKYYVYLYSNPLNNEVFYVGKGKGDRLFSHLNEESDHKKVAYLRDLREKGIEPRLEILIHGLEDEKTALRVESSVIDLLGVDNLTNKQSGYKSATFGRMSIEQVRGLYKRDRIDVDEPSILIRINREFRYTMTDIELYDFTRGHWVLNPERANRAKYAFAIYQGIVQEVYEIVQWFKAGTTYSVRQGTHSLSPQDLDYIKSRFEFVGNLAPADIREKYKYKSLGHYFLPGNSNPIMYQNV